ncbi:hypothetical protein [Nocardia transvalensis]|uniref:hypothetical protein n=1 Tax=Nocardia transvalensis TaxID=37333 RepID=UPI00189533DC|nr:hypothetical protein [Nocardia transvalensis]MBF6331008.1 hypothetical protein [Nocardia transvalensis]
MRAKRTGTQWVSWALGAVAIALIPWMVLLGRTLPAETTVRNWSVAWIGLDVLLTAGCVATALLLRRRDERSRVTAAATAAVAVLDGWFDLTTAASGPTLTQAAVCAVGESALAVVCCYLALRART